MQLARVQPFMKCRNFATSIKHFVSAKKENAILWHKVLPSFLQLFHFRVGKERIQTQNAMTSAHCSNSTLQCKAQWVSFRIRAKKWLRFLLSAFYLGYYFHTRDSHGPPLDQHEMDFNKLWSLRNRHTCSACATVQRQNSSHRCRRNTTFMYDKDYTTSKYLGTQVPISDDLALRPSASILTQNSADRGNAESMLHLDNGCHVPHCVSYARLALIKCVQKMLRFIYNCSITK